MIIIEVTNARDVVRKQIGRLGERLIGKVADAESQVEKALIQEIENAFNEFGIEARILSVKGPNLKGTDSLQIPLQIREERDVILNN
ncbi:cytochrome-c oxidase [Prochlorococcus marinus]|uniref:cytochrome-c oxidase n=1 Tax=Prochlorococcus marinus TaxID=1219 RepID=UPI0022B387C4|nr:cytochrome-c oxidase [Prochlorococcus marinus]